MSTTATRLAPKDKVESYSIKGYAVVRYNATQVIVVALYQHRVDAEDAAKRWQVIHPDSEYFVGPSTFMSDDSRFVENGV